MSVTLGLTALVLAGSEIMKSIYLSASVTALHCYLFVLCIRSCNSITTVPDRLTGGNMSHDVELDS